MEINNKQLIIISIIVLLILIKLYYLQIDNDRYKKIIDNFFEVKENTDNNNDEKDKKLK